MLLNIAFNLIVGGGMRLDWTGVGRILCLSSGAINGVLFQGGHGVRFALVRSDCVMPLTI